LHQIRSFIECLGAEDTKSSTPPLFQEQINTLDARFSQLNTKLEKELLEMDENAFDALLSQVPHLTFPLKEKREKSKELLSFKEEKLISTLEIDGLYGWESMWGDLLAHLNFEDQGQILSFGQMENRLSNPKREIRKESFEKITQKFKEVSPLFARVLNHLGGFRLHIDRARGNDSLLKEPLRDNRMKKETLDTMWKEIGLHRSPLVEYMKGKAQFLGLKN